MLQKKIVSTLLVMGHFCIADLAGVFGFLRFLQPAAAAARYHFLAVASWGSFQAVGSFLVVVAGKVADD